MCKPLTGQIYKNSLKLRFKKTTFFKKNNFLAFSAGFPTFARDYSFLITFVTAFCTDF
jgi:hypothetical protein